jgi:lipopolysaccharide/colanic/teichoic acid biosynthesis glycosyltransferase
MMPASAYKVLSSRSDKRAGTILRRLVAAAALVLSSPVLLLTAAIVWVCLGRPLMFRQTRSGLDGQPFNVWKFRTMHDWTDSGGQLLPDEERQTSITRMLRRLRLDELPQLLAIAKGEMAFVGPRPLLPATIKSFGRLGELRGAVPPGLTGWAQVNGNTRLSNDQKLALDLWYVQNRGWKLDALILVQTLLVVLRGERLNDGNLAKAAASMAPASSLAAGEPS